MLLVGLTGGIGAGKSSVAARLVVRGALLVDADQLAREVVAPGTPGLAAVSARFGPGVITATGELDRPALGQLVFADELARADLERIIHPAVAQAAQDAFAQAFARENASEAPVVVIHDVPLLTELNKQGEYNLVLVVQTDLEQRLERLASTRGMAAAEARSRIAAQASDEERAAIADEVIRNDGTPEQLDQAVDALWETRIWPLAQERVGQAPGDSRA